MAGVLRRLALALPQVSRSREVQFESARFDLVAGGYIQVDDRVITINRDLPPRW